MVDDTLTALAAHIQDNLGESVERTEVLRGELTLHARREDIQRVLGFLRDDPTCDFKVLLDICGADYPDRGDERFDVIYHLLSMTKNARVRVKIKASETTSVETATKLFAAAGWCEREVWDLFGITFAGNADLRRILTDYGFDGHPLRKDFPLTGNVELRYDSELRRVVYEPVTLQQDFRNFDNLSPWEGMTAVQNAGDQKSVKPAHGWRGK
jgi:NADH-quinone oxidoreductase subunit C